MMLLERELSEILTTILSTLLFVSLEQVLFVFINISIEAVNKPLIYQILIP